MLVDPEDPRRDLDSARPAATVAALDEPDTTHLAVDARLDCELCDDDGYNAAGLVCDHQDHTQAGLVARAQIREFLTKGKS